MLHYSPEQCCGCTACAAICPKSCISMQQNHEGFLYPQIHQESCVHCGLCESVCPIYTDHSAIAGESIAYAAINKNEDMRMQSSSGGMFPLLATYILDNQGIVFGAAFDENFQVKHIAVSSHHDLYKLQGSKYVQSDIRGIYKQAKEYLRQKKLVLFSGTPCQVEGLRLFLQQDYENLFLVDIICHGVPSPLAWKEYLYSTQKHPPKTIEKINFRDKKKGWLDFCLSIKFTDNSIKIIDRARDPFMRAFLRNISLRQSCSSCLFKQKERNSDITLADFWGIETILPSMHDNRGTSLLIIHSKKGKILFNRVQALCHSEPIDLDMALKNNSAMTHSVVAHPERNLFFSLLGTVPFNKLVNKLCKTTHPIKQLIRAILKKLNLLETARRIRHHIRG